MRPHTAPWPGLTPRADRGDMAEMRAGIDVAPVDATTYRVTVTERGAHSTHLVTLDPAYHDRLTGGAVDAAELILRSFEFLLEREPKESILPRFDLPVIGRYFPEYERDIQTRVRR